VSIGIFTSYSILLPADGMYMMEVDRVLRPGGYWILSGPPVNWKTYYKTWKRSKQDAEEEQKRIENIAEMLCWDKIYEKGDTVIWQKKANSNACQNMNVVPSKMCDVQDADDIWYAPYVYTDCCQLLTCTSTSVLSNLIKLMSYFKTASASSSFKIVNLSAET
jgi:hypothetical protein